MEKPKNDIVKSAPENNASNMDFPVDSRSPEEVIGQKILSSIRNALTTKPGENAAFREWLLKLHPGDQLPRGTYFRKKSRKHLIVYHDEFMEFSFH